MLLNVSIFHLTKMIWEQIKYKKIPQMQEQLKRNMYSSFLRLHFGLQDVKNEQKRI